MAAPVGHIVCALALLNTGAHDITDKNAFIAGTSFPDIRYISPVKRSITHKFLGHNLSYVFNAKTPFEAGRRFHVFVDMAREQHMRENNAYRFVKSGPLKTQMLKLIEDHILFDRLKGKLNEKEIFSHIYDEEKAFLVPHEDLLMWHSLLQTYLDQSYWFNVSRYFCALREFQKAYGLPKQFFGNIWLSIRTLGFFIYAYYQVEKLSRNKELRAIILDFYDKRIQEIIKDESKDHSDTTAQKSAISAMSPMALRDIEGFKAFS